MGAEVSGWLVPGGWFNSVALHHARWFTSPVPAITVSSVALQTRLPSLSFSPRTHASESVSTSSGL